LERVKEVSEILAVRFTHLDCTITKTDMKCSNIIISAYFSAEKRPTLFFGRLFWQIEELQTVGRTNVRTQIAKYCDAINDGLVKLNKYYHHFEKKPHS